MVGWDVVGARSRRKGSARLVPAALLLATAACGSSQPGSSDRPVDVVLPSPPETVAIAAPSTTLAIIGELGRDASVFGGGLTIDSALVAPGALVPAASPAAGSGGPQLGGLSALGTTPSAGPNNLGLTPGSSVPGPKANVTITIDRDDSHSSNAPFVVASMRPSFRSCYQRALGNDPFLRGKATVRVTLGAKGEVTGTATKSPLDSSVLGCVIARISRAEFEPPSATPSELVFTAVFALAPP